MDGILPLNKDRGMTSHDAVFKCRKIFKTRKVGHSGTLDPNVDGVLPICVGRATKAVNYLMVSGKVYKGEIILGFATETEDLDGAVVAKKAIERPFSQEQIDQAMAQLTGEIIQIPPMYSAVKVNGKRLYELNVLKEWSQSIILSRLSQAHMMQLKNNRRFILKSVVVKGLMFGLWR